ncbi:MAG: hypothetical protein ACE5HI_03360, partial [bacterium]
IFVIIGKFHETSTSILLTARLTRQRAKPHLTYNLPKRLEIARNQLRKLAPFGRVEPFVMPSLRMKPVLSPY